MSAEPASAAGPEPGSAAEAVPLPLHRRTVTYEAFTGGADEIRILATFLDERPWNEGPPTGGVLHRMQLEVTVQVSSFTITSANAAMSAHPHAECPFITDQFDQLVGLRAVGGFGREISKRFSGVLGCSHLHELSRGLGPAIVQASISFHSFHRKQSAQIQTSPSPGAANSCHIWAIGGIGDQKFAAGWRIGDPDQPEQYPVPPLEEFLAESSESPGPPAGRTDRDR